MAIIYPDVSRTFSEFLLLPNLTTRDCTPTSIDLTTPLVKYSSGNKPGLKLNIPIVSAIMQSVSNDTLAIALARTGGLSFIYGSQSIQTQADMVRKVKKHKSGFVVSDSNVSINHTLKDVIAMKEKTGHSTIAVTHDGTASGKLLGIVTGRDYRLSRDPLDKKVSEFMTPFEELRVGQLGITLSEANDIIWEYKLNSLPIIDKEQRLHYLVFRKDYDDHKANPEQLLDPQKRLVVGAGINTRDYKERVPELINSEVDVLCVDSSDGFTEYQRDKSNI